MKNTYMGDFTRDEIISLENFSGYKFWKLKNEYSNSGYTIYTKHSSWGEEQRMRQPTVYDTCFSLYLASKAGKK